MPSLWDEYQAGFGGTATAPRKRSLWDAYQDDLGQEPEQPTPRLDLNNLQPQETITGEQTPLHRRLDLNQLHPQETITGRPWAEWFNPPMQNPQPAYVAPVEGGGQGVATSRVVQDAQQQAAEQEIQRLAQLEESRNETEARQRRIAASKSDPKVVQEIETFAKLISESPPVGLAEHDIALKIPPQHRDYFIEELRTRLAEDQNTQGLSYGNKLQTSLGQGVVDMLTPLAKASGVVTNLDPDQIRFRDEISGVRHQIDPNQVQGFGGVAQQTARMTVPMVSAIAAASIAGTAGGAAGLGRAGQSVARAVGTGAVFYPMTFEGTYESMLAEGVDPGRAKAIAASSATVEAAAESILPNPLKGYGAAFRGTVRDVAKKLVIKRGTDFFKEDLEEGLQRLTREIAIETGRRMDEQIPNQGYGQALEKGVEEMIETGPALALMMAPGGAVDVIANVQQSAARPARLEELQSQRTDRPDISTEARKWVEANDNPEAVAKVAVLADSETVSRGAFEDAVGGPLRIGDRKLTQDERGAFAKAVKDRLQEGANNVGPEQSGRVESVDDDAVSNASEVSNVAEQRSGVVGPNGVVVSGRSDSGGGRPAEPGETGLGGRGGTELAPIERLRQLDPAAAEQAITNNASTDEIQDTIDLIELMDKPQGESNERPVDGTDAVGPGDARGGRPILERTDPRQATDAEVGESSDNIRPVTSKPSGSSQADVQGVSAQQPRPDVVDPRQLAEGDEARQASDREPGVAQGAVVATDFDRWKTDVADIPTAELRGDVPMSQGTLELVDRYGLDNWEQYLGQLSNQSRVADIESTDLTGGERPAGAVVQTEPQDVVKPERKGLLKRPEAPTNEDTKSNDVLRPDRPGEILGGPPSTKSGIQTASADDDTSDGNVPVDVREREFEQRNEQRRKDEEESASRRKRINESTNEQRVHLQIFDAPIAQTLRSQVEAWRAGGDRPTRAIGKSDGKPFANTDRGWQGATRRAKALANKTGVVHSVVQLRDKRDIPTVTFVIQAPTFNATDWNPNNTPLWAWDYALTQMNASVSHVYPPKDQKAPVTPEPVLNRNPSKPAVSESSITPPESTVVETPSTKPADAVGTSRSPSGEGVREDAAPVAERELWEQTRSERATGAWDVLGMESVRQQMNDAKGAKKKKLKAEFDRLDAVRQQDLEDHRASVEQAIRDSKPVPPEVLADYPDLQSSSTTSGVSNAPVTEAVVATQSNKPREQLSPTDLAATISAPKIKAIDSTKTTLVESEVEVSEEAIQQAMKSERDTSNWLKQLRECLTGGA